MKLRQAPVPRFPEATYFKGAEGIENDTSTYLSKGSRRGDRRIALTPFRKALVALLALTLLGTFSLGVSGNAAAAQNAPSWSTGNQWVYSTKLAGSAVTLTMLVQEQTTLTIGGTPYPVWHVNESASASTAGGSFTFWSDVWLTVDGLKQAKTSSNFLFPTSSTYDPPQPQMVFPLSPGVNWSGTTNVTTTTAGSPRTTLQSYSGTVTAEQTIIVPAGTFTTEVIKSPATGSSYTLTYYSEQVGNIVRSETYLFGTLTDSQNLTSYSYSPGLFGISNVVWIIVLVFAFVVITAAVVLLRRRPRMPYPVPPQAYPPYQQPPSQQPPQQGPPGGSPPGP